MLMFMTGVQGAKNAAGVCTGRGEDSGTAVGHHESPSVWQLRLPESKDGVEVFLGRKDGAEAN